MKKLQHAYFTCTCIGIHPGRVGPTSSIELTMSRTDQAWRFCASSLDTFTQSFLHRAWLKTRGPEIGFRTAHVFSWPPARLRHVRGGVGRRRSSISSLSGHLAAWPNKQSLLCTSSANILIRQRRRRVDPKKPFGGLSYRPCLATAEQNRAHYCLVDPALYTQRRLHCISFYLRKWNN